MIPQEFLLSFANLIKRCDSNNQAEDYNVILKKPIGIGKESDATEINGNFKQYNFKEYCG